MKKNLLILNLKEEGGRKKMLKVKNYILLRRERISKITIFIYLKYFLKFDKKYKRK